MYYAVCCCDSVMTLLTWRSALLKFWLGCSCIVYCRDSDRGVSDVWTETWGGMLRSLDTMSSACVFMTELA